MPVQMFPLSYISIINIAVVDYVSNVQSVAEIIIVALFSLWKFCLRNMYFSCLGKKEDETVSAFSDV